MYGRLDPARMFPAGVAHVRARHVPLATGVTVRLLESGPGHGPPVLLLHGWGGSAYMFRAGIERLAHLGRRVLAPDLRGFGLSDKPTAPGAYSTAAFVADVVALLDALSLERVALVGQSMGRGIALQVALRHPGRVVTLGLVNPVGLARVPWLFAGALVPQIAIDAIGRHAVPRWVVGLMLRRLAYGNPKLVSERDIDEYWAPSQFPEYAHALRASLGEFDWEPAGAALLLSLRAPATVVLGAGDRLVSPDASARAARGIPDAQVTMLPGGHCVHEEHPDLVYPLIANAEPAR